MARETRIFWWVAAGLVLAVVGLYLAPRVEDSLAPELEGAVVGIELGNDGVARVGHLVASSETPVAYHAILVAQTRGGDRVYFTEASGLEIDGAVVPQASIRRWSGRLAVRALWFTVEGVSPVIRLEAGDVLGPELFAPVFRPDWPRSLRIPARLETRREADAGLQRSFGTAHPEARIELYDPAHPLLAVERYTARPAGEAPALAGLTGLTVALPPPLAEISALFGLPRVEPVASSDEALLRELVRWTEDRLAFSRASALRRHLEVAGNPVSPEWLWVSLGEAVVAPGDLLRVGQRVVVLFEDRGEEPLLDGEDLCVDFERGIALRTVEEVFGAAGQVEWAPWRATPASAAEQRAP